MGYLDKEDYKEIRELIDIFVPSTNVSKNLFRALIVFLATKNDTNETKVPNIQPINIENSKTFSEAIDKEFKNADKALKNLTNKLFKDEKSKKTNNKIVS